MNLKPIPAMDQAATVTEMPVSLNGQRSHRVSVSANLATRYLCIAPYLRRAMLPDSVIEPVTLAGRPPMPVGRTYALRVLYGAEGKLPMPDVDIELLRRHCGAALNQTVLRDLAAAATVIVTAWVAPWSSLITVLLIAAAIVAAKRVKLSSPVTIAAATGIVVAVIAGWRSSQESYAVPLISLGVCFLIYFADIFWSLRQVRHLLRMPLAPPAPSPAQSLSPAQAAPARTVIVPFESQETMRHRVTGDSASGQPGQSGEHSAKRAFYDKKGIIGAGTSFSAFPLTIPIDKPINAGEEVPVFTAAELQEHIAAQIRNQGARDEQAHGYARSPAVQNGDSSQTAEHLTYALPYLKVETVVAAPRPGDKKHRHLRVPVSPVESQPLSIQDRSPSAHPERHYIRATTASWDGQLVVSVYVSTALQGHNLRMVIRPYVLGPIVSELSAADDIAGRNFLIRTWAAALIAWRQFGDGVRRFRRMFGKERAKGKAADPRPGGRSTRERYAQLYTENLHQTDDADRIIRIVELKIAAATMQYLRSRNIATQEYEANIVADIKNHVSGQGNTTTATSTAGG